MWNSTVNFTFVNKSEDKGSLVLFNQEGNALPVPGSKYNISTENNVPLEHGFQSKNFIQKLTVKKDTENTFLFKTRQEFTGDLFFPSAGA